MPSIVDAVQKPKCLFLTGTPRGGTSWALKVLDSHPAIYGCHEPFYQLPYDEIIHSLVEKLKSGPLENPTQLLNQIIKANVDTHRPPFFKKEFLKTHPKIRSLSWMAAKGFRPARSLFEYISSAQLNSKHQIVIKNRPFIQVNRILETIQSDVLILLRHPCAVVNSWLKGIKMGVMEKNSIDPKLIWEKYSNLLRPLDFTEAKIAKMSLAGLLAINWLIDMILFDQLRASSLRTRTVVYCDLIRKPLQEWSRIFNWIGMEICPSVEKFLTSNAKLDLRTLMGEKYSYFSVKKFGNSSDFAWEKNLEPSQISEIRNIIEPHFSMEKYWPESWNRKESSVESKL